MKGIARGAAERDGAPARRVRWRGAAVIVALAIAALVFVWVREEPLRQNRTIGTGVILLLSGILLLAWALFFAGFARRVRVGVLVSTLAVGALFFGLVEVRGVTGDLLPILAWRWRAKDGRLASTIEPTQPPATERVRALRDWPQFLGPERDGVVRGHRLARDWSARPPRVVWRRELGAGWSSFAVAGDLALTQEQRGEEECLVAYDLGTGEPRWLHAESTRHDDPLGGVGPRATPAIDGGRVFALGATGRLTCVELESGALHWKRDVLADAGATLNIYGAAGSPLVLGELVVVSSGGGSGATLVAYARDSGEVAWTGRGDDSGYCSPSLHVLAGEPQVVTLNEASVTAHDPRTGALLWSTPWSDATEAVAQPLAIPGDRLVVSSGYGVGAAAFEIARDEAGAWSVAELWESRALKAKFANFVQRDGFVYGFDDGILACIDLADGRRKWKGGRYGHGQLLLFDDLLLVNAESGELVLVEAVPEEFRELATAPALSNKTWNGPAFAPPYLLLRNDLEAVCLELALEPPAER